MLLAVGPGCAPGPTEPNFPPPPFGEHDSVFTDAQLLAAAYSTYTVPPGFYAEPVSTVPCYYVNSGSIVDWHYRPALPWTELSTEDVLQARAWAELSVAYSTDVAGVAPTPPIVTSRYFEFLDAPGTGVTHVRMRVHRSSYLSGLLTFMPGPSGPLATFNERPVGIENVRLLAEYLWTHSGAVLGDKVLSVIPLETSHDVDAAMFVVRTARGDYGIHDTIRLSRLDYRVDKLSGDIRYTPTVIRQILGVKR